MELRQFFFKTLILVGTLIGLYALFQLRGMLLLFFGAILFASTIRPAVVFLKDHGVPPILSILVIYLGFLASLVAIILILFPSVLASIRDLLDSQTTILLALEGALRRIEFSAATGAGISLSLPTTEDLQRQLAQFQVSAQQHFDTYFLDGFALASESVILFVLAFYWLTERDRIEAAGLRMLPLRHRERFVSIINEIESTLGAFVRGQTILCVTVGVLAFIALSLVGVRSAVVLAVFAGVAEAIPMIGPIIGALPAVLVALMESPEKAVLVAVAYLVIQQFEANILVPKVMERQVGLSPLVVLLALTSGNLLGGIGGALVAIPIAAALKILVQELIVAPSVEANQFPRVGNAVLLTESGKAPLAPAPEPTEAVQSAEAPSKIIVAK